jgi:hypothetical protein
MDEPFRAGIVTRDALKAVVRIHDDAQGLLARLDLTEHPAAAAFMSSAVDAIARAVADQRQAAREIAPPDLN